MTVSPRIKWSIAAALVALAAGLAVWPQLTSSNSPRLWDVEVEAVYPHDPQAFTQGLAIHAGALYEGTGQYGASSIRKVDLESGEAERLEQLSPAYFGEGITILGNRLYQLTWRSQRGFVYDVETFEQLDTFSYTGEGWGLTNDGTQLILSDGSATIRFIDPQTFALDRVIRVRGADGQAVANLNELEFVDGEIWANIWYDDRIVRIAPDDGRVLGWIDASAVYPRHQRSSEDVLNGIAYDPAADRLFITGKNWPQLYEIELVPR